MAFARFLAFAREMVLLAFVVERTVFMTCRRRESVELKRYMLIKEMGHGF